MHATSVTVPGADRRWKPSTIWPLSAGSTRSRCPSTKSLISAAWIGFDGVPEVTRNVWRRIMTPRSGPKLNLSTVLPWTGLPWPSTAASVSATVPASLANSVIPLACVVSLSSFSRSGQRLAARPGCTGRESCDTSPNIDAGQNDQQHQLPNASHPVKSAHPSRKSRRPPMADTQIQTRMRAVAAVAPAACTGRRAARRAARRSPAPRRTATPRVRRRVRAVGLDGDDPAEEIRARDRARAPPVSRRSSTTVPAGASTASTQYTSGPRSIAEAAADGVDARMRGDDPRRHVELERHRVAGSPRASRSRARPARRRAAPSAPRGDPQAERPAPGSSTSTRRGPSHG